MDSPSNHRRHHSTGYPRPLQHTRSSENVLNKPRGHVLIPGLQGRRRPGSESDILERPSESTLSHQDSIQLGYHQRPTFAALKGSSTGNGRQVKPVYIWTKIEVQKWLKRHAPRAAEKYAHKLDEHEITGRALIALNDAKLTRMGIAEQEIRDEMVTEILKLRLKNYMHCFKGLERVGMFEVI